MELRPTAAARAALAMDSISNSNTDTDNKFQTVLKHESDTSDNKWNPHGDAGDKTNEDGTDKSTGSWYCGTM